MTQTQVKCFMAAAQEENMTRAANRLYISQPAISKSVAAMEEELGFELFIRGEKGLALTYAGRQLYEFFEETERRYSEALTKIMSDLHGKKARIRLGCPDTWNPNLFYARLEDELGAKYLAENLSIECFALSELVIRLKSGRLDMILTHDLYDVSGFGIAARSIAASRCGILYAKKYFPNVCCREDFGDAPFLVYDVNIQKRITGLLYTGEGKEANIRLCSNQATAIFELSRGQGIMIFTDWDGIIDSKAFGFLPIDAVIPVKALYLEGGVTPAVSELTDRLRHMFLNG